MQTDTILSLLSDTSIRWTRFKCIDLDANGIITRNEMQFFYEEQLHRMECMAQEAVLFEDILCQMIDMIGPEVQQYISCFLLSIFSIVTEVVCVPSFLSESCDFVLCLIVFYFLPQNESHITLHDLKGSKLSGNVFNILFNLNKFMAFETRDPFLIRQVLII